MGKVIYFHHCEATLPAANVNRRSTGDLQDGLCRMDNTKYPNLSSESAAALTLIPRESLHFLYPLSTLAQAILSGSTISHGCVSHLAGTIDF